MVPSIAQMLAARGAAASAEPLYLRLLALVESWSVETVQPLHSVAQNYARFLMQHADRRHETVQAIERFRNAVLSARGPESGWQLEVLRLQVEFASQTREHEQAIRAAEEFVTMVASLSGTTSEGYVNALQMFSSICESGGDSARAVALSRQMAAITDTAFPPHDPRRAFIRMQAAHTLARHREFEEAERLATEAVSLGGRNAPQREHLLLQLEQIRRMKTPGAASPPQPAANPRRWFGVIQGVPPPPPPPPPAIP
jgi:hypothetical protein